jgi:hypothetical protein
MIGYYYNKNFVTQEVNAVRSVSAESLDQIKSEHYR